MAYASYHMDFNKWSNNIILGILYGSFKWRFEIIIKSSHSIVHLNWPADQCGRLWSCSNRTLWYLFSKLWRINKMGWICFNRILTSCSCFRLAFILMLWSVIPIGCFLSAYDWWRQVYINLKTNFRFYASSWWNIWWCFKIIYILICWKFKSES